MRRAARLHNITRYPRLLLILCICWPAVGRSADAPLQQAWQAFQQGQTDQVIQQVEALLPSLTRSQERRDAHLLLGACAHLRGKVDQARDQIITALSYDLSYQPDPLLLAPDLQQLIQTIAKADREEIKRRAAERPPAPPEIKIPATLPTARVFPSTKPGFSTSHSPQEPTPLHLAMLPIGVGQFANGHRAKAWTLLAVEGGLAVTSLASLIAALSLSDARGQYPPDTIGAARALNVIYLVTAYTAGAVMIYGLVDGLYHRRGSLRKKRMTWVNPGGVTPGGHAGASLSLTHLF